MWFWNRKRERVTVGFRMPLTGMVKRENYWTPRDDSLVVDAVDPLRHSSFDDESCAPPIGFGVPGVRYGCSLRWHPDCDRVLVTFGGHHSSGEMPTLTMSLEMAEEFAELLTAAVLDGRIHRGESLAPIPFTDMTCAPCGCGMGRGER